MAFPTTGILDAFNRANGALGSNWGAVFGSHDVPYIWTNAMVGVSSADNSAYWNAATYQDCEVYADMDADTYGVLYARLSDPNTGTENLMVGRFRADTDQILFGIVYNGSLVTGDWLNTIGVTVPAACQIGMTVTNDGNDYDLEFFLDAVSAGTYTVTNGAVTYPDLAAAGYIGLQLYGGGDTLGRSLDNFGGGTIAATLYTVPTGCRAIIDHIRLVNNTSSPVDVTMSIGADAASTRIWDSKTLAADESKSVKGPFTLESEEIFQAFAGTADAVTISAHGWLECL